MKSSIRIFVFGSNLAGRHGRGAALFAVKYRGAILGIGIGRQGNSYAIPTKDTKLKTLPLNTIKRYVDAFLLYAEANPYDDFEVTRIGCGLAGYKEWQISPMFKDAPSNCMLSEGWRI